MTEAKPEVDEKVDLRPFVNFAAVMAILVGLISLGDYLHSVGNDAPIIIFLAAAFAVALIAGIIHLIRRRYSPERAEPPPRQ